MLGGHYGKLRNSATLLIEAMASTISLVKVLPTPDEPIKKVGLIACKMNPLDIQGFCWGHAIKKFQCRRSFD